MKKYIISSFSVSLILLTFFSFKPINPELEIGAAIPKENFKMMDISGTEVSLAEAKGQNGLLVIFSCNTCPYVKLSEARIKEVAALAKKNNIGVILVNSNEDQRTGEDSFEEMKKYASSQAYDFYYVVDKNSQLADAFGATRTPHCFLFNKKGLAYRGAIDDNVKDANDAKEHFLRDAITAVGTGKPVKISTSKSVGCSIKRLEE